jgi:hypothetical protein
VLQVKMWAAQQRYLGSGMYVTDATEQAEREWLMLDPETGEDSQENSPLLQSSPD